MTYPRLLVAGTHSGVGKTTVTLALLAGFRAKGRRVQPFKVGPDFIDPGHHHMASGRESRNLDGWMLGTDVNRTTFQKAAQDSDLSIIEGMMGLFDGSSPINEIGSSAEIAKQLKAPVLLVVDGSAMARSAAAMVFGFVHFDPDAKIAGVVFNRIKSEGHYHILKEAVEKETNVPVVGYLQPNSELTISDRHLGLRTALEGNDPTFYLKLGEAAASTLDLESIVQLAEKAQDWNESAVSTPLPVVEVHGKPVRVGVAHDAAFCFYYPENLSLLEQADGVLSRFSPIHDVAIPDVDVLYLGGGYPEVYAKALAANSSMRQSIKVFAQKGGVIYAECGGLLYLTNVLRDFDGTLYDMVGLIPAEGVMSRTHMTLGYRTLTLTQGSAIGKAGMRIRGHEFHYSTLQPQGDLEYVGQISDAQGRDRGPDGIVVGNVTAFYTHLHFSTCPQIPAACSRLREVTTLYRLNKKGHLGMRTFLERILLVGGGMTVLLFLPLANLALAKTLVAIVSDRSAADLAGGADYFHRRHAQHQLVFRSNSQISRMSDTEVESLFEGSDIILAVAIFEDTAVRLQSIFPRYTNKLVIAINSAPALVRQSRDLVGEVFRDVNDDGFTQIVRSPREGETLSELMRTLSRQFPRQKTGSVPKVIGKLAGRRMSPI